MVDFLFVFFVLGAVVVGGCLCLNSFVGVDRERAVSHPGDMAPTCSRQRDLFPLPLVCDNVSSMTPPPRCSRAVQRRGLKKGYALSWANDAIGALNRMAGFRAPATSAPAASVAVTDGVRDAFLNLGPRPLDCPSDGALRALLGCSKIYAQDLSDLSPYTEELVSWPSIGAKPIEVLSAVHAADQPGLAEWERHLLRDPCDAEEHRARLDAKKPYCDPALMKSQSSYGGFLQGLHKRGMLAFRRCTVGELGALGVFFVLKKDGMSLRIVFDTRFLNCDFIDAPSTSLPSGGSFARIETDMGEHLYIASCDISNAFYGLRVPRSLANRFTLPPCRARFCGGVLDDGTVPGPQEMLIPYLVVLPMGWSWALHYCQSVISKHTESIVGIDRIVADKEPSVSLTREAVSPNLATAEKITLSDPGSGLVGASDLCGATYVDNVAVLGLDPSRVNAALDAIANSLSDMGLVVHEVEKAKVNGTFVGLEFVDGRISTKRHRMCELRFAIEEFCDRGNATGGLLEIILGHITCAMLLRREAMSVLDACHDHVKVPSAFHSGLVFDETFWTRRHYFFFSLRTFAPGGPTRSLPQTLRRTGSGCASVSSIRTLSPPSVVVQSVGGSRLTNPSAPVPVPWGIAPSVRLGDS